MAKVHPPPEAEAYSEAEVEGPTWTQPVQY